jgi:hypothetical protein
MNHEIRWNQEKSTDIRIYYPLDVQLAALFTQLV